MRIWSTTGGALLAGAAYFGMWQAGLSDAKCWTAAVTALCAVWWIFESLPLAATSLVPLAVFPLAGVLAEREVAAAYGDPIVLLFMGGFMLSKAAERCDAHRRIAQAMMRRIGTASGRHVVLAFMLTTAMCSMWISNTATALMMLPVALAVLEQDRSNKLGVPLLLSIAYGATIGGVVTPIGTPPNGVFLAVFHQATGETIQFYRWMLLAGPVAIVMLLATWLVLCWRLSGTGSIQVETEGRWTSAQKRTLAVFGLAALAWITREVPLGGWSDLLPMSEAGDATVALLAVLAMFLIPSGEGKGQRLLDWPTAVKIPWGILLLFGGGIAIAKAFKSSGLSHSIGELAVGIQEWPLAYVTATICLCVTFLTEITSNTATSNVLLPTLAAVAESTHIDPKLMMIPATLSVSFAFMLPVATPPNAIVCGSGHIRILDMARVGLVLNLIGVVVVTLACLILLPLVFDVAVPNS